MEMISPDCQHVGHCFKNLLFVPMSISRMLPVSIQKGNMEEVEWMLARNSVNIRYLNILSNEFAAASKDPNEGFGPVDVAQLLQESVDLIKAALHEQSSAGRRAVEFLKGVGESTHSNERSVQHLDESMRGLQQRADELHAEVARFRT